MSNYIFLYHGGKMPKTPEQGAKGMEKWNAWVNKLGDALVNPNTPFGKSKLVSTEGIADNDRATPLLGFSVLKADSLDAALEVAKGCPFLEMGTIEVAEMKEM